MATAYSANDTKLFYKDTPLAPPAEIPLLMEVPELGAAPEKIDVTTLSSTAIQYIPGIKDYGDLVFKFLYDNAGQNSNYRVLKGLEGTAAIFQIEYPDKTKHQFSAIPSVKLDAGAINGALTFSATMKLQSDIEVTDPAA